MRFNPFTRLDVYRSEPEAEKDDVSAEEEPARVSGGGSVAEIPEHLREHPAQGRREAKQARERDRQELAELREFRKTWESKSSKFDRLLAALEPEGEGDQDGDLLEPEGRQKFREDVTRTTLSEVEKHLETRKAQEQGEQDRIRAEARADARAPYAAEHTRAAELAFMEERGLTRNEGKDEPVSIDDYGEGAWTPEKWYGLTEFMIKNRYRFPPSGPHGNYTVNDYELAEFAYDKTGVAQRFAARGQESVLDHLSPRNGRERAGGRTEPPGQKIDLDKLEREDKPMNPFQDENQGKVWFDQPRTREEGRRMKRFLRNKFPEFLEKVDRLVVRDILSNTQDAFLE